MLQNLSAVCLKNFIYLSQKQFLLFSFSSLSFTKNRLNSPFIILKKNELYQSQDIRFLRRRTSYGNIFRNTKASLLPVWAKKALRFLSKTTFSGLMLSGIHLWEVVRMKKMTALLLASVMTVSLAACGGNDDDDAASSGPGTQITAAEKDETEATHTIKIGVFEPTTGENSNGGKQEVLGIRYANAIVPTVELNGTVYNIELVEADNQSDKVAAVAAAESLIVEGVAGVIGSYGSGVSNAAGQTFADANVPAIGASCTNPQVTAGNKYYFRTTFMDPFQGRVIASYAAEQGYRTAAVISQNGDDYSTGIAAYFRQAFTDEKIGGKVVADEAYHAGETEFDEICRKFRKPIPTASSCPAPQLWRRFCCPRFAKAALLHPFLRQIPGKTFPW